ncbi:MAG: transposase [Fimbriiglobus sp.]
MRQPQDTVSSAVIHQYARCCLVPLQITQYKTVPIEFTINLLLRIAATATSLFNIARQSAFSYETARKAVRHNLPKPDQLQERITDALHLAMLIPSRVKRRRSFRIAIDTHHVPYYGDKTDPGVVGGQKKAGTKFFHTYATACIIDARCRYTVAFIRITPKMRPHEIVTALLNQLRDRNFQISAVIMDSGFDGGETLLLLQERGLKYVVPLKRNGNKPNRRNALFDQKVGTVDWAEWKTEKSRRKVKTRVYAWQGVSKKYLFAFGGWTGGDLVKQGARAAQWYRSRFGIETSYRQKNQGRGFTTSDSESYRMLLEGLALLLRQIWVYLTREIAAAKSIADDEWVKDLPLLHLLSKLDEELKPSLEKPQPKPPKTLR